MQKVSRFLLIQYKIQSTPAKFCALKESYTKVLDKFVLVQFYAGKTIATTGPFLTCFSTRAPPSTDAKRSPASYNFQKK